MTGRQMAWATPGEGFETRLPAYDAAADGSDRARVGTILSIVNQDAVIIGGHASTGTWLRVAANFFVPFCVSSVGFLCATRVAREPVALVEPESITTSPVGGAP